MGSLGGGVTTAYDRMGDERVVAFAKDGCRSATEHLLRKYRHLVEGKAGNFFLVGAEHDDVVQEGMIGLYKAIRDFSQEQRLCGFRSFADLCITRQIITAIKTASRQKHWVLNSYVSIESAVEAGGRQRALADVLPQRPHHEPQNVVLGAQFRGEVRLRIMSDLSDLEAQALLSYIEGDSYHEIAGKLDKNVKQIDNALQRAKKKIRHVVGDGAAA